jgi:hypothetical protein
MDLLDFNSELLAEFARRHGADQFKFPTWWAQQVRDASRIAGRRYFASLTKHEQHRLVLDYLRLGEDAIAPI